MREKQNICVKLQNPLQMYMNNNIYHNLLTVAKSSKLETDHMLQSVYSRCSCDFQYIQKSVNHFVHQRWTYIKGACVEDFLCTLALHDHIRSVPDSKVHGANIGPTWVLSAPDGPHVGPMNLAIWDTTIPCVCEVLHACKKIQCQKSNGCISYFIT